MVERGTTLLPPSGLMWSTSKPVRARLLLKSATFGAGFTFRNSCAEGGRKPAVVTA